MLLNPKMMISAMQAQIMLANGCMGFLASVVDKTKEKENDLSSILVVREFVEVFSEELLGIPP